MRCITRNNREIIIRKLNPEDYDFLCEYFANLTSETTRRFGPHAFDKNTISQVFADVSNKGYIAIETAASKVVAYCIVKLGFLDHDRERLKTYRLVPGNGLSCTFAPSVADEWQSQGIGDALFQFILTDLKSYGIKRIILWGGVQADNDKAVNFYLKYGFIKLGVFEYYGRNFDMAAEI